MFVCYFTKNQKTRPKIIKKKTQKTRPKKKEREEDVVAYAYIYMCVCVCVFLCSWNVNSILHCIKGQGNVQSNGYCNIFLCF